MISTTPRARVAGARRAAAFALVLAIAAIASCSSDPPSDLGSDNDLIGSRPGTVFDDTLVVSSDTVLTVATCMASDSVLQLGRQENYQRSMLIQISFAGASADQGRVVQSASLRLKPSNLPLPLGARFYRQDFYAEGDPVPSLDTLDVIPDALGNPDRMLTSFPIEYSLPKDLVQEWIEVDSLRSAIAIVYNDIVDTVATFRSRQAPCPPAPASCNRPQLRIVFESGPDRTYSTSGDATFVRATTTTTNLIVSDGHVRRIYVRLPLDQLNPDAAVHSAHLRLHMVAGSVKGNNTNLIVFIPASDDVSSTEFLTGQLVTSKAVAKNAEYVDFPITNALALMLQGTLDDNGFVIRFDAENSEIRQVQFYGTSAPDSLRPRVYVTTSTKADFHPKGSSR